MITEENVTTYLKILRGFRTRVNKMAKTLKEIWSKEFLELAELFDYNGHRQARSLKYAWKDQKIYMKRGTDALKEVLDQQKTLPDGDLSELVEGVSSILHFAHAGIFMMEDAIKSDNFVYPSNGKRMAESILRSFTMIKDEINKDLDVLIKYVDSVSLRD